MKLAAVGDVNDRKMLRLVRSFRLSRNPDVIVVPELPGGVRFELIRSMALCFRCLARWMMSRWNW